MRDVDGFIFDVENVVILFQKYTGKNKITPGNHRENTGNFASRDEWEPCKSKFVIYTRHSFLTPAPMAGVIVVACAVWASAAAAGINLVGVPQPKPML